MYSRAFASWPSSTASASCFKPRPSTEKTTVVSSSVSSCSTTSNALRVSKVGHTDPEHYLVAELASLGSIQSTLTEPPLALPAVWAQRDDMISCLTEVRAVMVRLLVLRHD